MQFDEEGIPFDPINSLKYYGKPKKSIKVRMHDINDTSKNFVEAIKEYEDIYKPKNTDEWTEVLGGGTKSDATGADEGHAQNVEIGNSFLPLIILTQHV